MTGTKKKIPFWATLFTLLGLIVLCTLGTWQLQRLAWKQEILNKLDAAYENPTQNPDLSKLAKDEFVYASIRGRFLFNKAILLGHTIKDEQPGQFFIIPLDTGKGTLLVNMGFNPNDQPLKDHFLRHYNRQYITFSGIIRKPEWNSFTPENNPEENIWYRTDITQIAEAKDLERPIPFVMYAQSASRKFDAQFPNNTRWEPNNNHMQYALFWFAMAGALIVIYILRFLKK